MNELRLRLILFITLVFASIIFVGLAHPAQKYNPHTGEWVTVADDAEIVYNPFDHSWTYQQPGSKIEHNPFNNKWEYAPPPSSKPKHKKTQPKNTSP